MGTSGCLQFNLLLKAGADEAAQGFTQLYLENFQGWRLYNFPGSLFQSLTVFMMKKFFLISN